MFFNKINVQAWLFFELIEFCILLIPQLTVFTNSFVKGEDQNNPYQINFFITLSQQNFLYLTDSLNALLFLDLCLFTYLFLMVFTQTSYTQELNQTYKKKGMLLSIFTLVTILGGKVLNIGILTLQVLAAKCYYGDFCLKRTDVFHLITNIFGILLLGLSMLVNETILHCSFPNPQIPWATSTTKKLVFQKISGVMQAIFFAFQVEIYQSKNQYIVLLILVFNYIHLFWMNLNNFQSFSRQIDNIRLVKATSLLILTILAFVLSVFSSQSNFFIILFAILSSISLSAGMIYFKHHRLLERMNDQYLGSNEQALTTIYSLVMFSHDPGFNLDYKLREIFSIHVYKCNDLLCLCRQGHLFNFQNSIQDLECLEQWEAYQFYFDIAYDDKFDEFRKQKFSTFRTELLLNIYYQKINKKKTSALLVALNTFVQINMYQKLYSSFYQLYSKQDIFKSRQEKQDFQQLVILSIQAIEKLEQRKDKVDVLNVDKVTQTETMFIQYKSQTYEIAQHVQNFWNSISEKDQDFNQILEIGIKIVENYVKSSQTYDIIIDLQPDFVELIKFNIMFYSQVMNFVSEEQNSLQQLRNIQQKIKIQKKAYNSDKNKYQNILVCSHNRDEKNKVIYANKSIASLLGYQLDNLIGSNISMLIPQIFKQQHSKMQEEFLASERYKIDPLVLTNTWILNQKGFIIPVEMHIHTYISYKRGYSSIITISKSNEIDLKGEKVNLHNSYIFLTYDNGEVSDMSENIQRRFISSSDYRNQAIKLNINDIFKGMLGKSASELLHGIEVQFIFQNQNAQILSKSQEDEIFLHLHLLDVKKVLKGPENQAITYKIIVFFLKNRLQNDFRQFQDHSKSSDICDLEPQSIKFEQLKKIKSQSSNESLNKQSEVRKNFKESLNLKQTPISIINLKRALLFFFLTLILTSFSIMAVSRIQNNQFSNNLEVCSVVLEIQDFMAGALFSLRMMILSGKSLYVPFYSADDDFFFFQKSLRDNYYGLRKSYQYIQTSNFKKDAKLIELEKSQITRLVEVQEDASFKKRNESYLIAWAQWLTKVELFLPLNASQQQVYFANFNYALRDINHNSYQRDGIFVIRNGILLNITNFLIGDEGIQDMTELVFEEYIRISKENQQSYKSVVLVICLICVFITLIASMILFPYTYMLDNEQEENLTYWLFISNNAKEQQLKSISDFLVEAENGHPRFNELDMDEQHSMVFESQQSLDNISESLHLSIKQQPPRRSTKTLYNNQFSLRSESPKQLNLNQHSPNLLSPNQVISKNENDYVKSKVDSGRKQVQQDKNLMQGFFFQESQFRKNNNLKLEQKENSNVSLMSQHDESNIEILQQKELEEQAFKDNYQQLKKIYFKKKVQKFLAIMTFSFFIVGFYLGCYFIQNLFFNQATQSFSYQQVIAKRLPCSINTLMYLYEQIIQNRTIHLKFETEIAITHTRKVCTQNEDVYKELITQPPSGLKTVDQTLRNLDTKLMCDIVFEGNRTKINECGSFYNGILSSGLYNSISLVNYHVDQFYERLVSTDPATVDIAYINYGQMNTQLLADAFLVLEYIVPVINYIKDITSRALLENLNKSTQYFNTGFSFFIIFLIGSLIFSEKFIIKMLKMIVFRTRILIKIVPVAEFNRIKKFDLPKIKHK